MLFAFGQSDPAEAMPGMVIGLVDHGAVGDRREGLDRIGRRNPRVLVQLQAAAPVRIPFGIEIDQDVDSAVILVAVVEIEIEMDIQLGVIEVFMGAAAIGVLAAPDQILDAGDRAEPARELAADEGVMDRTCSAGRWPAASSSHPLSHIRRTHWRRG